MGDVEVSPASRAVMTAALLFVPLAAQTARGRFGLSTCAPTSPSAKPALPHLQSLHVDVVRRLDEDTLAVLLDACPQLQELTIDSTPAPYDVLVWVGQRCHELGTLILMEREAGVPDKYRAVLKEPAHYPCVLTPARWDPLPFVPALPQLMTLDVHSPRLPRNTRAHSFALLAAYLVHSAPSLRYLRLHHLDWLKRHRALLSKLGQLTQLRGPYLGNERWMLQGQLARGWRGRPCGVQRRCRGQVLAWRLNPFTHADDGGSEAGGRRVGGVEGGVPAHADRGGRWRDRGARGLHRPHTQPIFSSSCRLQSFPQPTMRRWEEEGARRAVR